MFIYRQKRGIRYIFQYGYRLQSDNRPLSFNIACHMLMTHFNRCIQKHLVVLDVVFRYLSLC